MALWNGLSRIGGLAKEFGIDAAAVADWPAETVERLLAVQQAANAHRAKPPPKGG